MKTRDEMITHLVDEIVGGTLRHERINLAAILDAALDEPLFDTVDQANLVSGGPSDWMDIVGRVEKTARAVVLSWLQNDPGGKALVDEQMEREREEEREAA